jgi:hypothetical protein
MQRSEVERLLGDSVAPSAAADSCVITGELMMRLLPVRTVEDNCGSEDVQHLTASQRFLQSFDAACRQLQNRYKQETLRTFDGAVEAEETRAAVSALAGNGELQVQTFVHSRKLPLQYYVTGVQCPSVLSIQSCIRHQ